MNAKKFTAGLPCAVIYALSAVSIGIIALMFLFVFMRAWPIFRESGLALFTTGGFDEQIQEAFYAPSGEPMYQFGLLGLLSGTLLTTLLAVAFAAVIGVGAAIVICEYARARVSAVLVSVVRLLASVPSVVFGLIGIITVVPLVETLFVSDNLILKYIDDFYMDGRNVLSAAIVLTFMVVPTVVSLSVDAIRAVPRMFRETGFAFGMSKFRVILRVVLPGARSGVIASIILAAGRAIGEAIAVSMVCGGLGFLPKASLGFVNFLAPTLPLAAAIVNKSEAMGAGSVEAALFACGALLLLIGALFSVTAQVVEKRLRKAAGHDE